MSATSPYIGIDFGTTNSSVAWCNPRNRQAETILNEHGDVTTPSLVYFDEQKTVVGKQVEELIDDRSGESSERESVLQRTFISIKQDLDKRIRIRLPGDHFGTPVDVAAEILKKLKRDAEERQFNGPVSRAVITYPAEFDSFQQQSIEEAGRQAGFEEVELLQEPVAAALAYAQEGYRVGRHVLVYDLGGGTFDLAVVDNEDGSFEVGMPPKGIRRCGGDDFDVELYDHFDRLAREKIDRSLSRTDERDKRILRDYRKRKENLSYRPRVTFSDMLDTDTGSVTYFRDSVDQETFENLIDIYVSTTVQLTETIVKEASARGKSIDTVVMVGGSSAVPLVERRLAEVLPVEPLTWHKRDSAVALGAAYHAHRLWGAELGYPEAQYRREVQAAWADRTLEQEEVEALKVLQNQLGLSPHQAAEIERGVLGDIKEHVASTIVVPDVRGKTLEEATRVVGTVFELTVSGRDSSDQPENTVLTQYPAPGEQLHRGTALSVFVSSGFRTVEVPDLTGLSLPQAGEVSDNAGLTLGKRSEVPSEEVRGRIVEQRPVAGTEVGLDTSVDVSISTGPEARDPLPAATLRHGSAVWALAVSPDGKILASGAKDGTIRLWDTGSGSWIKDLQVPTNRFAHRGTVRSLAISQNGNSLVSGGDDEAIRLWDMATGENVSTWWLGRRKRVWSVAISPDGRMVASGDAAGQIMVRTSDSGSGEDLRIFHAPNSVYSHLPGPVRSLAMSQDGSILASGGDDKTVKLWKTRDGQLLKTLHNPGWWVMGRIHSVAISPEGRLVASGDGAGKIRLWSTSTGELQSDHPGRHDSVVRSLSFGTDGRTIASGSEDRTVGVWSVELGTASELSRYTLSGPVYSVAISPDGRLLFGGDSSGHIKRIEVDSHNMVQGVTASEGPQDLPAEDRPQHPADRPQNLPD